MVKDFYRCTLFLYYKGYWTKRFLFKKGYRTKRFLYKILLNYFFCAFSRLLRSVFAQRKIFWRFFEDFFCYADTLRSCPFIFATRK